MKFEKKERYVNYLFTAMMIAVELLLLWTVRYGYGGNDESFYLTTAHRLTKGDSLLSQEWHLAQMSSFIVYPFMKIYLMFYGTTEGILLNFRLIFLAVKSVIAVAMFILLKKRYQYSAVFAVMVFMLFTPYNLLQLCYNSMGLIFLLLSGVLLISCEIKGTYWKTKLILSGVSLAVAVLNCPYLVIVYVGLFIAAFILYFVQKKKDYLYGLGMITIGCGIMAILFAAFVLSRASVSEIICNLPEMMKDPAHPVKSVPRMMLMLIGDVAQFYPVACCAFFLEILLITIDGIWNRKKHGIKRVRFQSVYLWGMLIVVIYSTLILFQKTVFYYNLIMFPPVFLGTIFVYISIWNGEWQKVDKRAIILGLYGIVYSILLELSSDNLLTIVSCGMAITSIATILLMGNYIKQKNIQVAYGKVLVAFFVFTQIGALFYSVTHHAYWEDSVAELNVKVNRGPLKGVITSEEHAQEYYNTIDDLEWFKQKEPGNFVYFSEKPYTYLYMDMSYGTHSGSSGDFNTHCMLDIAYFKLHPEKIPDYIYVEKKYVESAEVYEASKDYGYSVKELQYGYALEK